MEVLYSQQSLVNAFQAVLVDRSRTAGWRWRRVVAAATAARTANDAKIEQDADHEDDQAQRTVRSTAIVLRDGVRECRARQEKKAEEHPQVTFERPPHVTG